VRGIHDALGELRVVGEDEQATGIQVEPADWREPLTGVADKIVDGGATVGITIRDHVSLGLVQEYVDPLCIFEGYAI
jgi:hypothetical protein